MTSTITLTEGQQNALEAFISFLIDPNSPVFVLKGYSGTGKTTLIKELLERLPELWKTAKLLNPSVKELPVELTATTNKAAENFGHITGHYVGTVHSTLGLKVVKDEKTGESRLGPKKGAGKEDHLLFIDEASYIDSELLGWIFKLTRRCKIVFMGDPAQLAPVKSSKTPVFEANFPCAELTEVMRQAKGNPIMELSTQFRETVRTGEFFSFTPDGHHIQYLPRDQFEQAILQEFMRPDWRFRDSKILAWTNGCVVAYNHAIRDRLKGDPEFQVGDYAVVNQFVTSPNGISIKTDTMVCITGKEDPIEQHGVIGNYFTLDGKARLFCPRSRSDRNAAVKRLRANEEYAEASFIESSWVDLRAAFAQTVNKSQGSTYDKVFIDLDDIRRCNSGDQIARMLYVGVSRARHQVFFTGDLV